MVFYKERIKGIAGFLVMFPLFCSMPSVAAHRKDAMLPSEFLAHAEEYGGKHVDVRGYIVIGGEARNLFDSRSAADDPHGACIGLDGPDVMFGRHHARYIKKISGVFKRSLCEKDEICLYWCGESGIALDPGSKP